MFTAAQLWNLTVGLEVWAPAHGICYLQTISSLSSPAQNETGEVTCSKGTNTSTPIILKREAKITSAQTTRRVFSFFGTPPHADRFECSLLCLCGGGRKTTQELCFLVTANVLSAHFQASVNSPPRLDTASSIYSAGTSPLRRHPQLATILEHNKIMGGKCAWRKEIEVIDCFTFSWRFRGHNHMTWPLVTLPVYLGPIYGSGHRRKVSRLRLRSLDKQEWQESGRTESAGRTERAPPSQRFCWVSSKKTNSEGLFKRLRSAMNLQSIR